MDPLLRIVKEMLKAANVLCASANVPAIAGVFSTARQQQIAEELGFQKFHELFYEKYIVDDQVVFEDSGGSNYSAAFMAYRIPEVEESEESESQYSSRFNMQSSGSRVVTTD